MLGFRWPRCGGELYLVELRAVGESGACRGLNGLNQ